MIGAKPDKPRALRLTAQYADYWNMFTCSQPERIVPMLQAVDAACTKTGRDPATLQRTSTVLFDVPVTPRGASLAAWRKFRAAAGPEPAVRRKWPISLQAFARAGVGHVQVWLDPYSLAGIEAFAPVLELLDRS